MAAIDINSVTNAQLACLVGFLCVSAYHIYNWAWFHLLSSRIPKLTNFGGPFAAWKDANRYKLDSATVLREGYEKFSKNGLFYQVSTPTRWVTVIPPKFVDEVRAMPEEVLSSQAALADILQTRYIVAPVVEEDKFHFGIVKTQVTPNLEVQVESILDEIQMSFADEIGSPKDWTPIVMAHAAHRITTRTANRMLVGAPLCRNEEYLDMTVKYTTDLFGGADRIRAYPNFLKSFMANIKTNIKTRQLVARRHLIPYITARLKKEDSYVKAGKLAAWKLEKPSDSLQWIIDAVPNEKERNPERLMLRVLHLNVTAVHTTSVTFLNCIFDLAFRPKILPDLRQEVEIAVQSYGWTKRSINEMKKLDSFMAESQRLTPMSSTQLTRAVLKTHTFSDGTTIPAGSYIFAPMEAMYHDATIFPSPETFDYLRFYKKRLEEPGAANKYQFVSTSPTHINFGHGNAACPGRFFASNEIKMLLAHVLLNYDVKLEREGQLPEPLWYDRTRIPNLKARVMFRSRI